MTDGLRRRIPLILKLIAHSKLMNVVSLSHGKAKERYNKTLISSHCRKKIGDLPWNPWDLIIVCL